MRSLQSVLYQKQLKSKMFNCLCSTLMCNKAFMVLAMFNLSHCKCHQVNHHQLLSVHRRKKKKKLQKLRKQHHVLVKLLLLRNQCQLKKVVKLLKKKLRMQLQLKLKKHVKRHWLKLLRENLLKLRKTSIVQKYTLKKKKIHGRNTLLKS